MPPRVDVYRAWPDGYQAMRHLEQTVRESGLEHSLLELVKTRASQVNQCTQLQTAKLRRRPPSFPRDGKLCRAKQFVDGRVVNSGLRSSGKNGEAGRSFPLRSSDAINSWNRLAIAAAGKVGGYVAGSL